MWWKTKFKMMFVSFNSTSTLYRTIIIQKEYITDSGKRLNSEIRLTIMDYFLFKI